MEFSTLVGKTFKRVQVKDAEIFFWEDQDGKSYVLDHNQDCCESVYIESIDGDLAEHLPNQEIVEAYEAYNSDDPPPDAYHDDSHTWSFYVIRTMRDTFTIRFFGTSNGYYSETAELYRHDGMRAIRYE